MTENMTLTNPLQLKVTKNIIGVLETNIEQLEKYVNEKLDEYKPELYKGDVSAAKKDMAELNNSKKFLSTTRINLMRELMKPYEDFETRCKALEKKIDTASGQLDVIVKAKEEQEKTLKKMRCEELWLSKDFSLFSLDKVFNSKWLNKSTKESDINAEMDAIIKRTYDNLKTIEEHFADDAETLKAHYLITLDIEETFGYGNELEKKRKIAIEEARNREQREHEQRIAEQKHDVKQQYVEESADEDVSDIAMQALGISESEAIVKEFVFSIKATDDQLLKLKSACNALSIEYDVEELTF